MNKLNKILCLGLILLCLWACKKENNSGRYSNICKLQLNLQANDYEKVYLRSSAASVNVDNFRVKITRPIDDWSKSFERYAEMPRIVELAKGDYVIEATYENKSADEYGAPKYYAKREISIKEDIVTPLTMVCSIDNVGLSFVLSDNFKKELSNYEVVVNYAVMGENQQMQNKSLTWKKEDLDANKVAFLPVENLQITVKGYRKIDNGTAVVKQMNISNVAAKHHYIVYLDAVLIAKLQSLSITIDNRMREIAKSIEIDGFQEIPMERLPQENDGASPDLKNNLTFSWDANPSFAPLHIAETMDVKIGIKAKSPIQSCKVAIKSDLLSESIADLFGKTHQDAKALDLDLIEEQKVKDVLGGMGVPTGDNIKGMTEVTLDFSQLIPLVKSFSPQSGSNHIFELSVGLSQTETYTKTLTFIAK